MEIPSEDQIRLGDRIGELADGEAVKGKCPSFFEGNDQHPAAAARGNRDRLGAYTADPGVTAGLDFSQGFVVVDVLGMFSQIDDNFRVPIRQEPLQVVGGAESLEIDQILDGMIQRKIWLVNVKYHLGNWMNLNLIG